MHWTLIALFGAWLGFALGLFFSAWLVDRQEHRGQRPR